jgi:hypothetical protein
VPEPALLVVLFLLLLAGVAVLSWRKERQRREALAALAEERGWTFHPERDRSLEIRYPLFACLRQGSNRHARHLLRGQHGGRDFAAFDYHYQTTSYTSKGQRTTHHHHFSAVVIEAALPLQRLAIRPEGLLDALAEFFGLDDIDFKLAWFSRAFHVKAPSRRWAFDVLHQATMEFLLQAPRFTIELEGPWVMVRRERRFAPGDFLAALDVGTGILDRLPEYLLREMKGVQA